MSMGVRWKSFAKGRAQEWSCRNWDRWFRLKLELLSKWAEQFAEYVRPFEVMSPDGKTAKLIYTTLASAEGDGSEQYYALDLRNTSHQNILKNAVDYATKERVRD